MQQLGSKTFLVDGVTVFADHADPDQFWYLPTPVRLARRGPDARAQLTMIRYRPAVADGGVEGGGFLMIETEVALDADTERRVLAQCRQRAEGAPTLSPVPFDDGSVQCIALNLQGPGGTTADPTDAVAFVRKILGAAKPSLHGRNSAAFSLTLDQDGATILEQALRERGAPIGVIYELRFTALRPSLSVEITADFSRVYESLRMGVQFGAALPVGGLPIYLQAGLDRAFEQLQQDGAIQIEVVNASDSADARDQERWALDFFKQSLMAEWFRPTLAPVQVTPGSTTAVAIPGVGALPNVSGIAQPPAASPDPAGDGTASDPAGSTGGSGTTPPAGTSSSTGSAGSTGSTGSTSGSGATGSAAGGAGGDAGGEQPPTPAPAPAPTPVPAPTEAADRQVGIGLTFQLQQVEQEELKTLRFRYDRTEAVHQTYAPQGFVGILADDLGPGHFISVDLDDPFFREVPVLAELPGDRTQIGLHRADVSLSYGRASDPGGIKRKDLTFSASAPAEQRHSFFMNPHLDLDYEAQVTYHFDPQSGWQGERSSYQLPPKRTQERTLLLNPYEQFGFRAIRIVPGDLDAAAVRSTDVRLRYADPGGFTADRTITVTPNGPDQVWRLRLTNPEHDEVEYVLDHHLVDGTRRSTNPLVTTTSTVTVNDPFPDALNLDFVPVFTPGSLRMVFADVVYHDPDHSYRREETLEFDGGNPQRQQRRIALFDPARRTYTLTYTVLGLDGQIQRLELQTTEERLFVGETF